MITSPHAPSRSSRRAQPRSRPRSRLGFTLIELMIVVAIIAVLAAIGSYAYGRVVKRARINEAVTFMASVHGAQELYFNHYTQYARTANNNPPIANDYDPAAADIDGQATRWDAPDPDWAQLGVRLPSRTHFQYVVMAGGPNDNCNDPPANAGGDAPACTSIVGDPVTNPPGFAWYYIVARANQDGDTTFSVFGSSNTMNQDHWSLPDVELE